MLTKFFKYKKLEEPKTDELQVGSRTVPLLMVHNRVNVAISRAQCLAVVVADPRIAATPPGSLDEMTLINLFCKLSDPSATA